MPLHRLDLTPNPNKLAESFGTGLEMLAAHKLEQMSRNKGIKRLQDFGLSPQEAAYAQSLPAKEQFALVQQLAQSAGGPHTPEQMMYNSPTLNTNYSEQAPLYNEPQNEFQRNALVNALGGLAGVPGGKLGVIPPQGVGTQRSPMPNQRLPIATQQGQQPSQPRTPLEKLRASYTQKEQELIRKEAIKQQMADRKEALKEMAKEKEAASLREIEGHKETKKYYDTILESEEAAKKADVRLGKMEKLIEKGGLPISAFYNLYKTLEEELPPSYGAGAGAVAGGLLGSVIPGLGNIFGAAAGGAIGGLISPLASIARAIQRKVSPNTEEFEKLSADFVRDAKAIYGSRLTDADLKSFMMMIPTVGNTDSGKKAIIHNMQILNKGSLIKAKYLKEIVKQNKGRRPIDLPFLVEERSKPELDKLSAEFISG